jgi:hypothetical protein
VKFLGWLLLLLGVAVVWASAPPTRPRVTPRRARQGGVL